MSRYYKIIEFAYLVIAVVFVVETVLNWNSNPQKSYIYLAFSALAVFMYFFKRKYRKKFENKKNNQ
ncbi:MAG: hypothetical protein OEM04_00345 [Flavobacteriaceae bacterium]|nr:hypothetical protein [Flavobacteriaceae bacterium]